MSAIFATLVLAHGIPALRHDWWWPLDGTGLRTLYEGYASGWLPYGIGSVNPDLQKYLAVEGVVLIFPILGSAPTLFVLLFGIAATVVCGARSLLEDGAPIAQRSAVATFALFNPWTYNKVVAGHAYIVLAYGGVMFVVAELARPRRRDSRIALAFVAVACQLQFAVAVIGVLIVDAARRRVWLPLASALVLTSPSLVGVALQTHQLVQIPETVAWFDAQSLAPQDVPFLRGYFSRYDGVFAGIFLAGPAAFAALAAYATLRTARSPRTQRLAAAGIAAAFVALGVRAPLGLGHAFAAAFERIPQLGLFRELYNFESVLAIAYVALTSRLRFPLPVWRGVLAACAVTAAAWFVVPPASFWVDARTLPRSEPQLGAAGRYALMPPFQPMSFAGKGSGADPDLIDWSGRTPLNDVFASYPVDAALARYACNGDPSWLAALGVDDVRWRPGFRSIGGCRNRRSPPGTHRLRIPALSTFVLEPLAVTPCVVCTQLAAAAVFFGDAGGTTVEVVRPRRSVDAGRAWIDARLLFATRPELAQAFGGAATSSTLPLAIVPGMPVLVDVAGALRDDRGRVVSRSTPGYVWLRLPRDVTSISCRGSCAVALQGDPPRARDATAASTSRRLESSFLTPWLARVALPAHGPTTLVFRERFDPAWLVLGPVGRHVRIDGIFNGWTVAGDDSARTIFVVEGVALAQAILEIAATIWIVALAAASTRRRDANRTAPRAVGKERV